MTSLALALASWLGRVSLASSPQGSFIEPCLPGTAAYQQAEADLARLDGQVRSLRNGDDPFAAGSALAQLVQTPCFALSVEHKRSLRATNAMALRTFWEDGGAQWLESYLLLGRTPETRRAPRVVVPPDLRPTLSLDADVAVPEEILCRLADEECGRETRGWQLRAERAFRLTTCTQAITPLSPGELCGQQTRGQPRRERYMAWRACIEAQRPLTPALPLGSFRSPASGSWLFRGHRGAEPSCAEIRLYDLATGATFVGQRCPAHVSPASRYAMDELDGRGGRRLVRVGRVSPEALREAALMTLLAFEVRPAQLQASVQVLPAGIEVLLPTGEGLVWKEADGMTFDLHALDLDWAWVTDRPVASGKLAFPSSPHPGADYAAGLWAAVEASIIDGCPGTRPRWRPMPVNPIEDDLLTALDRVLDRCGSTPPRHQELAPGPGSVLREPSVP